jgi:hypothetical protein
MDRKNLTDDRLHIVNVYSNRKNVRTKHAFIIIIQKI